MADRNYSLTIPLKYGPFTSPRWVNYLLRVLTGLLLALPFMLLGWTPEFAWLPGTALVVLVRRARVVWKGYLPVGFERWPFPFGLDDIMLDFSLQMMLMPLTQFISRPTLYEGVIATVVTIILVSGFLDRYPDTAQ